MSPIPQASDIKRAIDRISSEDREVISKKVHELRSAHRDVGKSPEFVNGYLLGLATAEVVIESDALH